VIQIRDGFVPADGVLCLADLQGLAGWRRKEFLAIEVDQNLSGRDVFRSEKAHPAGRVTDGELGA
jgi:hypothetical protein